MVKHRSDSASFKRLVAQEYLAGNSLTELSHRHGVSRVVSVKFGNILLVRDHSSDRYGSLFAWLL
jgi:hypothetical protein